MSHLVRLLAAPMIMVGCMRLTHRAHHDHGPTPTQDDCYANKPAHGGVSSLAGPVPAVLGRIFHLRQARGTASAVHAERNGWQPDRPRRSGWLDKDSRSFASSRSWMPRTPSRAAGEVRYVPLFGGNQD